MKIIIFGATGWWAKACWRECLLDPAVEIVSRSAGANGVARREAAGVDAGRPVRCCSTRAPRSGYDACFFLPRRDIARMSEATYQT